MKLIRAIPLIVALSLCFSVSPANAGDEASHQRCGEVDGHQLSAYNLSCRKAGQIYRQLPRGWTGANVDAGGGLALLFPAKRQDRVFRALKGSHIRRSVLGRARLVMAKAPYETHRRAAVPRVPSPRGDLIKPSRYRGSWISRLHKGFSARSLRWREWGKAKTSGRGRFKACHGGRCHSFQGKLQFRHLMDFGGCGGVSYPYYTEAKLSGGGEGTPWRTVLSCD
jgi:hypothetical protein